jgi:hypothetical protein
VTLLSAARIGYAGYSRDFSAPGDRRRFAAYARQSGLSFEYPDPHRDYDLVVITQNADLAGWSARKRDGGRFRLVFDLVDAYFEQTRLDERLLKGFGRFMEGRDSRLSPDFQRTLKCACQAADAVICSTPEQRETIMRYNGNVAISFDWFDDELGPLKQSFERSGRLKLVWEGMGGLVRSVQTLREPLNALKDRVELHVVTDPTSKRWYGRLGTCTAEELLAGIECPINVIRWIKEDFWRHITAADLAIIPMDMTHSMIRAKPANKLILLWKLGMPVLAGPTEAYRRAMAQAGLDMLCETPADWAAKLEALASAPAHTLADLGRRGYKHAKTTYTAEAFRAPFDAIFASLGFEL